MRGIVAKLEQVNTKWKSSRITRETLSRDVSNVTRLLIRWWNGNGWSISVLASEEENGLTQIITVHHFLLSWGCSILSLCTLYSPCSLKSRFEFSNYVSMCTFLQKHIQPETPCPSLRPPPFRQRYLAAVTLPPLSSQAPVSSRGSSLRSDAVTWTSSVPRCVLLLDLPQRLVNLIKSQIITLALLIRW